MHNDNGGAGHSDGQSSPRDREPPGSPVLDQTTSGIERDTVPVRRVPKNQRVREARKPVRRRIPETSDSQVIALSQAVAIDDIIIRRLSIDDPAPVPTPPQKSRPRRRATVNPRTRAFRRRFFPEITDIQWNDWRWQSQHRIRRLEQFEQMIALSDDERDALIRGGTMLPVGVTPYYMSLLDADDPHHALAADRDSDDGRIHPHAG